MYMHKYKHVLCTHTDCKMHYERANMAQIPSTGLTATAAVLPATQPEVKEI